MKRIWIEGEKDAKAVSTQNGFGVSGFAGVGVGFILTRASKRRRFQC
jgi:hypothetical protein